MRSKAAQTAALMATPDETEAQFYDALQAGDLARLMECWADDEEIAVVHPGGPRVVGAGPIRAAFAALFEQGRSVSATPERVRRLHTGDTAIHHVLERVRIQGPDGVQQAWVIATNVFLKTTQGWRLVLHHASPGTPHDIQEVVEEPTTLH
jgi:ketosteroid isomerase-like protein